MVVEYEKFSLNSSNKCKHTMFYWSLIFFCFVVTLSLYIFLFSVFCLIVCLFICLWHKPIFHVVHFCLLSLLNHCSLFHHWCDDELLVHCYCHIPNKYISVFLSLSLFFLLNQAVSVLNFSLFPYRVVLFRFIKLSMILCLIMRSFKTSDFIVMAK